MLVKDVMTRRAETIGPEETVETAAKVMRGMGIGALPVCENDRLIGVITDRDIVVRAVAEGRDPMYARVRAVMTAQVVYCFEEDTLDAAAHRMEERSVRRILVLDAQKRLVGLLSADDLAMVSRNLAAEVVEHSLDPGRAGQANPWLPIH